jgi:hypothetical protein
MNRKIEILFKSKPQNLGQYEVDTITEIRKRRPS